MFPCIALRAHDRKQSLTFHASFDLGLDADSLGFVPSTAGAADQRRKLAVWQTLVLCCGRSRALGENLMFLRNHHSELKQDQLKAVSSAGGPHLGIMLSLLEPVLIC